MTFGEGKGRLVSLAVVSVLLLSTFAGFALTANALHGKGSVGTPLDFWARDTDGDGRFNSLWVNVTLDVTVQDVFTFNLDIRDPTNVSNIGYVTNSTYYLVGTHVMQMIVAGFVINTSGVNGPYTVSVQVNNDQTALIAYPSARTAAYLFTDFEEPPAVVGLPFGDYGVDLDVPADGLFNQLHIMMPVNVSEAGQFILIMQLAGGLPPSILLMTFSAADVGPGRYDFDLVFGGIDMAATGVDGPYIAVALIMVLTGSGPIMIGSSMNTTGPYLASDFQTRMVLGMSGTVTDYLGAPVSGAQIVFANYTDLYQQTAITGPAGDYVIDLYPGNYAAVIDSGGNYGDFAENLTVTGLVTLDFSLRAPSPGYNNVTVVMSDLETMTVSTNGLMWDGLAPMRMMIDWTFGNRNSAVSSSEMALLLSVMGAPTTFDDTDDIMYMDGIFYYPYDYAGNKYVIDLSGPIVSRIPASLTSINYMSSNATLPSTPTHTAKLNVTLDQDLEKSMTTIILPPGWIVTGATPDPNIVYTGIGTGTFTVDPQLDPGGTGGYTWISVQIENPALMPPTVEGQEATPDPAEYVTPVLISAWVNDTSPISSVNVEVKDPSATSIGNFTMTLNMISGEYEYALSAYPALGTYLYTIWAVDTDGNAAFGTGNFVVQDTTNPRANAGPDQTVTSGATVYFNGAGSSDNFQVASWQWDFDDGTGPITLMGPQPSHVFNIPGVYTVTLTVTDTVGLTDTDTMTVNVTTLPTVNGQTAVPDPAEYITPVLISAWANGTTPIASVNVDILNPGGASIGNFTMTLNATSGKYEYTLASYSELGTYAYTIWAIDTDGFAAFGVGSFVVQDTTHPVAEAGPDVTVPIGTTVSFDGTGSSDNFQIASYQWDFDDGTGPISLTGSQPSHTFDIPGVYTVTLTVTDTVSLTGTDTMTVTVEYPPKPNPPTNVAGIQTAAGTVTLTWTAPTQNTNGSTITGPLKYLVFRSDSPTGTYSQITPSLIDATQFVETGLAPGTYYYEVEAVNQWGNHSEKSLYGQVTVTDKGSVNGTVASEGQSLADATVEILDSTGTVVDTASTASNGAFSFRDLSPGTYTIRASKDGYESKEKSVLISAFANTDAGIITLTKKSQAGELPWMWIILIVVVIVIVVSLVVFMMKRRKKPAEQAGPQAAMPPPPSPQMPPQQAPPQQAPPHPVQYPPPPPPPPAPPR